jgi:Rha family phage regulatory protein
MNHAVAAPNLAIVDGRPCTTSLNVAEVFGKQHKDVLKAIAAVKIDAGSFDPDGAERNFAPCSYLDANNRARSMYQITRDGFTLLAMGFTGKAAMKFKLAYIAAFNSMEAELLGRGDEAGRKRVEVNHSHLRATLAPGGLDIRYTLDLTKIIRSPSAKTINLLSRLTGIDMSDLVASGPDIDLPTVERLVARFVEECCVVSPESVLPFARVYAAYVEWFSWQGEAAYCLAARRRFSDLLVTGFGFGRDMRGGNARLLGFALRGGEEVQHG